MEPKAVEVVKKTIAEISYESLLLYEKLKTLEPDEFVSYETLSALIGRDVQKYRGHLSTAIKKCLRENHIVVESVRGEGVKRLKYADAIRAQGKIPKHIRSVSRRSVAKITSGDYDTLSKEMQVEHNARLSQLSTFTYFATEPNYRKIEQKVEQAQKRLPIGKTLDIFK